MTATLNHCGENSPFLLENEGRYQAWRNRKLKYRQELAATRVFELDHSGRMLPSTLAQLRRQIDAFNFVLFESAEEFGKPELLVLNQQLGLQALDYNLGADEDKVTSLRVVIDSDNRSQYIPYTNRAMNWHTDGYYNPHDRRIGAFALYCVNQADWGGGNYFFDHEMMYLLIRDQAPEMLEALMCDDLMLIPANVQGNRVVRAEESGPVFSLHPASGELCMRYTSRPHNIVWKSDKRSTLALKLVQEILMEGSATTEIRLQNRQGIICNNILHGRQGFHDSAEQPARLIYRARYYDTIDFDRGLDDPGSSSRD